MANVMPIRTIAALSRRCRAVSNNVLTDSEAQISACFEIRMIRGSVNNGLRLYVKKSHS
jgi:hypothetical protein